jgi:hypothetical protein
MGMQGLMQQNRTATHIGSLSSHPHTFSQPHTLHIPGRSARNLQMIPKRYQVSKLMHETVLSGLSSHQPVEPSNQSNTNHNDACGSSIKLQKESQPLTLHPLQADCGCLSDIRVVTPVQDTLAHICILMWVHRRRWRWCILPYISFKRTRQSCSVHCASFDVPKP